MTERPPRSVAVIGAGTMGGGIALAFALAGSTVTVVARRESSLAAAAERIERALQQLRATGADPAKHAAASVATSTSLEDAVEGVELVIETIPEDLAAKRDVLRRAESAMPSDALLTTDTSSLRIEELADHLSRPELFAGFHWFNPPELVMLVEVVAGPRTSEETVRRLRAWAAAIGKRAIVVARDVEGFVANRLQYALLREAYALVEAGVCTYADVDEALRAGLGPRWAAAGPFESMDLAGLDVHYAVAQRLFPELATTREAPETVRRLVEEGALGCKSGRGLYGSYEPSDVAWLHERRRRVLVELARLQAE